MTTATKQPLNARRIESVRQAVECRDSALVDLELAGRRKDGSEWRADRIREIGHCNHFIERVAASWGWEPAELIAECVPFEG